MDNEQSIEKLADHFLVGSALSGHSYVQNLYGMYIRFEQEMVTERSNMFIANEAYHKVYKPLIATSLDFQPHGDTVNVDVLKEGQALGNLEPEQLMRITRDYKDVLVNLWKTHSPDLSWEDFMQTPLGFVLISDFETAASEFVYDLEFSYEELVTSPHQVITSIVEHLLPRESNPELETFGQAHRSISLNAIDRVVSESAIRTLREGQTDGMLDSVGVYKQFLTPDQAGEVDEFVSNL
tara:strand:- start:637 stop:1350 length:714 start_codon:yes stop_codon:yes gene_type:complete